MLFEKENKEEILQHMKRNLDTLRHNKSADSDDGGDDSKGKGGRTMQVLSIRRC